MIYRNHFLKQKFQTLCNRIENAIKKGYFPTYPKRKQHQLLQRLQRYQRRLQTVLHPSLKTTLIGAGLLLATTIQAQPFLEQYSIDNPFNMVDVGIEAAPTFVDIDNDGDMDAFIGANTSIKFYQNVGSSAIPNFIEKVGMNNPLDTLFMWGINYDPEFVDIDDDGDMDVFIGEQFGSIEFYKNVGNNITPNFIQQTGSNNPFDMVNVGYDSAPTFVDIDNDGDMDAFIGEYDNIINYYKNIGNNTNPSFIQQIGSNNPFDMLVVGNRTTPTFVDIDNDGDMDAFSGNEIGYILHYKNIGNNTIPNFLAPVIILGQSEDRSTPAFVDIDNDGDMDIFNGQNNGSIQYFQNGFSVNSEAVLEEKAIHVFPNPVTTTLNIELDIVGMEGKAVIVNILGQAVKTFRIDEATVAVNVADLSQGQYVLKIVTDEGAVFTQIFVK